MNAYAYYNKKMNEYTLPIFDDHDADTFTANLKHSLRYAHNVKDENHLLDILGFCTLYLIGSFDSETGLLTSCKPVELCDCEKFIAELNVYEEN